MKSFTDDGAAWQGEPLVVLPKEGTNYSSMEGKNDQYVKISTKQSSGLFTLMEDNMETGAVAPPHKHLWHDECFYVTKGSIDFRVGERTIKAPAGTTVYVPRNTVHGLEVKGQDSSMIMFYTPGSFDISKRAYENLTPEQRKDMVFMKEFFAENDVFLVE